MKISIDIDGVLADFGRGLISVANTIWPGKLSEDFEPSDWTYTGVFTSSEFDEIWKAIKKTDNFWRYRLPYVENVQVLRGFLQAETDHEIYYITSRVATKGRPISIQTEAWLVDNYIWPEANYHAVLPVPESGLKRFLMADLGIEVSIDDYGPTVEQCREVKNHRAYVLDRPWNRDKDYGPRVYNLEQFLNIAVGKKEEDYFLV